MWPQSKYVYGQLAVYILWLINWLILNFKHGIVQFETIQIHRFASAPYNRRTAVRWFDAGANIVSIIIKIFLAYKVERWSQLRQWTTRAPISHGVATVTTNFRPIDTQFFSRSASTLVSCWNVSVALPNMRRCDTLTQLPNSAVSAEDKLCRYTLPLRD